LLLPLLLLLLVPLLLLLLVPLLLLLPCHPERSEGPQLRPNLTHHTQAFLPPPDPALSLALAKTMYSPPNTLHQNHCPTSQSFATSLND
jgi:hypothetical protein